MTDKILLGQADDDVFGDFSTRPIMESKPALSESQLDDLIVEAAANTLRSEAMGAALTWVDEGDYSFDALDTLVEGLASESEEDEDMTEDELEHYNSIMQIMPEALAALGASEENIKKVLDDEDEDASEALGAYLADKLDQITKDDDDLVSEFAAGGEMVLESTRMIRNGQTVRRRRNRKKKRRTAAQRAALKKARRKAHSSAARRSRKKSMRMRKKRGW